MGGKVVLLCPEERKDAILELAAESSIEVQWVDDSVDDAEIASQCADAVAILPTHNLFPLELARACPNLRLIQSESAGTDRLDIGGLAELGIRVANNGGGNAVAVAEHTIALIVATYRGLRTQFESARAGRWNKDALERWWNKAHELTGKTVGIVAAGHIGRQVARRLQGWDCKLVYHDVVRLAPQVEAELGLSLMPLDDLLASSDVVTLHSPLTNRTRGMIGERELGLMKPTAILVNTCRGPIVDEAALIQSLQTGRIAGAGLDVLEQEPTPVDNPLLGMENVTVTPHLAGLSQEAVTKSRLFALENAARAARGEEPLSVVKPE